jgi:iron complex outermembrane recepter protein
LTTADLRLFTNFGEIPSTNQHTWAKGLRIFLSATNLFDTHQTVRDATGATPVGFEPGYVDPLGRVVSLSVRKAF